MGVLADWKLITGRVSVDWKQTATVIYQFIETIFKLLFASRAHHKRGMNSWAKTESSFTRSCTCV
jgi:hypothetical protein